MLLALDVGNTNTKLGLYSLAAEPPALAANWRLTTHRTQTVDEYGALFINLFHMKGIDPAQVKHIIISSVVPPLDSTLRQVCETAFHIEPLFVEPGIKTGMPVLVDNPTELGADRLCDSIAAFEKYGGPCIVVDFGTATKFEVISERGEYLGGIIAPGLGLSAEALFDRAARLSRVDIKRPAKVIGTNTVGELALADPAQKPRVIASGGLAHMIAPDSRYISEIDDMLTLDGLRILFERNKTARPRSRPH
jgi:type III pantothenate kinase